MSYPKPRRARGFTLVELLVAVAILAIVAVLGWRALDGIVRSRQSLSLTMEQSRNLQMTFAQLQRDCEYLAPAAQLHARSNLQAASDRLVLVRTMQSDTEATQLQVVSYRLRNGQLRRRESTPTTELKQLDTMWQAALGDADPSPGILLEEAVASIQLRLWQDGSWHPATDSPPAATPPAAAVPGIAVPRQPSAPSGLEVSLLMRGQPQALVKAFLLGAI